jgi:D-serine deaminase-like pyridoxal phosphate-dependent protein
MQVYEYEVGIHKSEIETPALLIDLRAMEHNLHKMAGYFRSAEVKLRPHVKIHKATPVLAHMQLAAGGAVGVTCAKLAEAEVMAASGIKDILIANQVVGPRKIKRLVNLAGYSDIMVAVDSEENVQDLSRAAQNKGVQIRVLVEVNVGNNRCGVDPLEPALALARLVEQSPGLRFMGLMGYDGHCSFAVKPAERPACSRKANELLVQTRKFIEKAGLQVQIVSGGGTHTYDIVGQIPGVTEVQAGTYLLMDTAFKESGVDFECALSILSTVISRPKWSGAEDLAIIDVGRKGMDTYWGLPQVKGLRGAELFSVPQEHGRLKLEGTACDLRPGDKIELQVRDANGTVNLYDKFYAVRDEIVEAVWNIGARGKGT